MPRPFLLAPLLLVLPFCLSCRDAVDESVATVASLLRAQDYQALRTIAFDDSVETDHRCRAARALAWARAKVAVPAHRELLTFTACGWKVRAEAAWRLVEGGEVEAIPDIVALLSEPQRELRWNAARVLGHLGHAGARPALEACREDGDELVAAWCVWAVCELDGGDCERPVMDLTLGEGAGR